MFLHNLYCSKIVVRLKTDFSKVVKDFVKSSEKEIIINEVINEKCISVLKKLGLFKSKFDTVSYRLVKVILSTGETEILMTNLDNSFTINDLSEIYRLRWGIETAFFRLKSLQILGTFSGYSPLAIHQDIFINLIFFNLRTIAQVDLEEKVRKIAEKRKKKPSKRKKRENQDYQINQNMAVATLRNYLFRIFNSPEKDLRKVLYEMEVYLLMSLEVKKVNNRERLRKRLRQNDRHHTEKNYKRAF